MDLPFKTVMVSTDFSPLGNAALPNGLPASQKDHHARLVRRDGARVPAAAQPDVRALLPHADAGAEDRRRARPRSPP